VLDVFGGQNTIEIQDTSVKQKFQLSIQVCEAQFDKKRYSDNQGYEKVYFFYYS
jgi:hypothetical protein